MNATEITVIGVDEIKTFLTNNARRIVLAQSDPRTSETMNQYLLGKLEIVGSELMPTSTGIAVRLYLTESFRNLLSACGTGDL